jgi:hypothetical protein
MRVVEGPGGGGWWSLWCSSGGWPLWRLGQLSVGSEFVFQPDL